MTRTIRSHRLLVAGLFALVAASPLGQAAHAGPAAPEVPSALQVPAGHKLFLVAHATGFQVYRCDETPAGYHWSFVEPQASLFAGNGKLIGTHFGGPTWMAKDGNWVKAQRLDGVTVDATAIPWLLLERTSSAAGSDGARLAGTTFIQRIATTGGLPPNPAACNAGSLGRTDEVPYTADYAFWKEK